MIFWACFYSKKDIGIDILKSIKNKIMTFKLFQERPHKINQRQERAQRFKICGSFAHFTIIFVLYKKYLKILTVRIKKFLNHQSIGDRFSKKEEDTRTTSSAGASKHDRSPSHSQHSIANCQSSPAQSNTECKSQYMGTLP